MSKAKTFSDKVMDSIAEHLGLYIVIFVVGCFTFAGSVKYDTYTLKKAVKDLDSNVCEMAKTKANKTAVNHLSDQVYQMDTAINRKQIRELYHELTHQPPNVTRGGSLSFNMKNRAVFIWNMPIVSYSNNTD